MAITDKLKGFWGVIKNIGRIDTYAQLKDLQDENETLRKENKYLLEKMNIKEEILLENNTYWRMKDRKKDGPFCTQCWDSDNK